MRRPGLLLIAAMVVGLVLMYGGFLTVTHEVCLGQNEVRSGLVDEAEEERSEAREEAREERDQTLAQLADPAIIAQFSPELLERARMLAEAEFLDAKERARRDLGQSKERFAPIACSYL